MGIVARLLVLLPLLWVEGAWAVDCASNSYVLSSQLEVNDLGATGCDTIRQNLKIDTESDITNLDALANITSIGGDLNIDNRDLTVVTRLTNLDGLVNLSSVGGSLYIYGNTGLLNIDGLASLTSVGGYLGIENNEALADVDGLASVTTIGGALFINGANALTNLDGLANLVSVGGQLTIYSNASLAEVDGLASLTSVGGYIRILSNDALANLDGFGNLTSIGGFLEIYNNGSLVDIDGLTKLTSIEGYLEIRRNNLLENLDGLANVTSIGGYLNIRSNNSLTNLDGLLSLASVEEYLDLYQNQALINVDGLANLTTIEGYLYIRQNGALENLGGLVKLSSVGDYLNVVGNSSLVSLDGLRNLATVGGFLQFYSNRSLANCQGIAPVLGWPSGPPADDVVGSVNFSSNADGCNSVAEILASVSGPTKPVINQETTSSNSISLGFTPSTTADTLFPITGYSASCTGSEVDVAGSSATELLDNTPVQETLTVSGYDPTSVLSSIEVDIDITHSDPTHLYITLTTPEGTELILWNQGSTGGEDLVGTFPTTLTSVDSLDSVTRQTMDGDWVLSIEDIDVGPIVREGVLNSWGIRITEELARNGSGSPIEVLGATRGRDYTCTVAPVTKLGTTPVSDPYTVSVPLELPATPTITSTDYEDGKIILTVSVTDNGGTDITGYDATCTDRTNTFTGTSTSSPITVSGLTNGVAYTCTVTATNSVGTSSASGATDPITPEETSTGLPIWLLYQATQ